jgi:hypothetical protein
MAEKKYTTDDLTYVLCNAFKAFLLSGSRSKEEVETFLEKLLSPPKADTEDPNISIHCLCSDSDVVELDLKFCHEKDDNTHAIFTEICRSVHRDKRLPSVAYGVYICVDSSDSVFFRRPEAESK